MEAEPVKPLRPLASCYRRGYLLGIVIFVLVACVRNLPAPEDLVAEREAERTSSHGMARSHGLVPCRFSVRYTNLSFIALAHLQVSTLSIT